jgi:hypothetical protein
MSKVEWEYNVGDRVVLKFPNNPNEWRGVITVQIMKELTSLGEYDRYGMKRDNDDREYVVSNKHLRYEPDWYREERLKGLLDGE